MLERANLPHWESPRATRSQVLPDLPAIAGFVPGYEANGWQGIGAPRKTPLDVLDKLHSGVNDCLADPKVRARIDDLRYTTSANSRAEFGSSSPNIPRSGLS